MSSTSPKTLRNLRNVSLFLRALFLYYISNVTITKLSLSHIFCVSEGFALPTMIVRGFRTALQTFCFHHCFIQHLQSFAVCGTNEIQLPVNGDTQEKKKKGRPCRSVGQRSTDISICQSAEMPMPACAKLGKIPALHESSSLCLHCIFFFFAVANVTLFDCV